MFKRFVMMLVAAMAMSFAVGCGAQAGKTIVKYEKGKSPLMTEAPRDGTYALYKSTDVTPMVTYQLGKGDDLGFRDDLGKTVAVAGSHMIPVGESKIAPNYYWKYEVK